MGLESVTGIQDLVITNPLAGDPRSEGDDHIRNIKKALKQSFPNISGPLTPTHTVLNALPARVTAVEALAAAIDAENNGFDARIDALESAPPELTKASNVEALAGADDAKFITPAKMDYVLDARLAPILPITVTKQKKTAYGMEPYTVNYAIMSNKTLRAWGQGGSGQLGTGTSLNVGMSPQTCQFSPELDANDFVVDVLVLGEVTLVLTDFGHVYSSGLAGASYNVLGHGDSVVRRTFTRIEYFVSNSVDVVGIFGASTRLSPEACSAFALSSAGQVYSWGYNGHGQLGSGNTTSTKSPALIAGGLSNVTDVYSTDAAYVKSTFLKTTSGQLYATGYNGNGQLGLGDLVTRTAFTSVPSMLVTDVSCASGYFNTTPSNFAGFTLARKSDGTLWSCGYNAYGQLGLGDVINRNTFQQISGLSDIVSFQACEGFYGFSWAVNSSGRLFTWGYNARGQLGHGSTTSITSPTEVTAWSGAGAPPFNGKIAQVVASPGGLGYVSLMVLDTDGIVYYAGLDASLMCGPTAVFLSRFTPVRLPKMEIVGEKIIDIKVGGYDELFSWFGLTNFGNIYACGANHLSICHGGMTQNGSVVAQPSFRKVPFIVY